MIPSTLILPHLHWNELELHGIIIIKAIVINFYSDAKLIMIKLIMIITITTNSQFIIIAWIIAENYPF